MALYTYRKAPLVCHLPKGYFSHYPPPQPSRVKRIAGPLLITLGSLLIANVTWPLINYQLFVTPSYQQNSFTAPVPDSLLGTNLNDTIPMYTPGVAQVLGAQVDLINPSSWFPGAQSPHAQPIIIDTYDISIPKLNIFEATVQIDGTDLSQSLIQYPGTATPGEAGSTVVFGHSVLRQFYNPSIHNQRRYVSIFSTLMTLRKSDRIYVDFGDQRFTYEVDKKLEVNPDDFYILEQRTDVKELRLITCVPEGTYLRRGVVIARLVDIADSSTTTVLKD